MLEDERKEGFKRKQIVDRVRWRIFISLLKQMPFRFINDHSGLPCVFLSEPGGSSAQVLLYGGQVISWKNEQGDELLFKSSKPTGKSPKSIKGGISICFPQLGTSGASEKQGSSRSKLWSLDNCPMHLVPTGSPSSVDLILKPTANDTIIWPCSFELRILISLSPGKLSIVPQVKNTDNRSLSFTFAVRNYLSVSDISEVRVEGLETLDYLDNLLHRERFTEQADALTFDGEVDRIYLETQTNIAIIDHEKKRTFVLRKDGLPDAGALEKPIILKPKEEWKGCQELSTVSSSYCSGQLDPQMILQWL
ncbi:putative glucose-6-phosphate 1-epimerase isoform X2 [Apium graveolens]|uniref:putative glucose-6-phosphate 1-epimerase isoform X2 n=1 Tax=Apium graveolens TaxID=4045 RepID=UPI003D78EC03